MILIKRTIINRINQEADYILLTKKTIRETANKFNVSKSTVHKDLHERLINVNKKLYNEIKKIMENHIETRHIKGGEATKMKYKVTKK